MEGRPQPPRSQQQSSSSSSSPVFSLSPVAQYAADSDALVDALCFRCWDGVVSAPLLSALESVSSSLSSCDLSSLSSFSGLMGALGGGPELSLLLSSARRHASSALSSLSPSSLSLLLSSLLQLLPVAPLAGLPPSLLSSSRALQLSLSPSPALLSALLAASSSIDLYGSSLLLPPLSLPPHHPAVRSALSSKSLLSSALSSLDLSLLWSFSTQQQLSSLSSDPWHPHPSLLASAPVLPLEAVLSPPLLASLVDIYTNTLAGGGAMLLGSIMQYRTAAHSPGQNGAVMGALCEGGLGYAGSAGGALVALHGQRRASLDLRGEKKKKKEEEVEKEGGKEVDNDDDDAKKKKSGGGGKKTQKNSKKKKSDDDNVSCVRHSRLFARRKECARQLRKLAREHPSSRLSFRVNSDLALCCARLREHHEEENWADERVEAAWRELTKIGRFCVVELWRDDELLAADFCHLVSGGSVYVATRYSNRNTGALSPGFLLALAETRLFREWGYVIWDLGQTDSNPLMAYKEVVAHIEPRAVFMARFRALDASSPPPPVKSGVLIESLQESDLLEVLPGEEE